MSIFDRRDAEQYLSGVWVGIKQKDGSKKPYLVLDATSTRAKVKISCNRGGDTEVEYFPLETKVVDVRSPEIGAINYKKACLYLSRRTTRQWRRGFRASHVRHLDPTQRYRERFWPDGGTSLWGSRSITAELADEIWNPKYIPLDLAVYKILEGELTGAALNRNFYVYADIRSNVPLIGYKSTQFVATVDKDLNVKLLEDSLHLSEALSTVMP